MNHTKGPWGLRRDPSHYYSATTIEAGVVGARRPFMPEMMVRVGGDADIVTQEANARLISAAPDLLEALENLLAVSCGDGGTKPNAPELARLAINKALGIEQRKEKKE